MKKLIKIFLICTLLLFALSVTVSAETEGYYTYTVSNGESTITHVNTSKLGAVTIPSTLGGYPVTRIGNGAFSWGEGLTSIEIPDSVTTIGGSAFYGCKELTRVIIGDSVTTIGGSAFSYCDSLTSIEIPDSVTTIGQESFRGCDGLTSVVIGDSVTIIGYNAFRDCTGLINIEIPDSVTAIGDYVFCNCTGLTSVVIGDGVRTIGDYAFSNSRLTSIKIPDSVTTIGDYAFYNCTGLTNVVIGDSVTTIGDYAFCQCFDLTSVVVIPDSVITIGNRAFFGCYSLTSVVIGDSVKKIGDEAFYVCDDLKNITVSKNNLNYCSDNGILFSKNKANLICYPAGKTDTFYTIPDSVTTIGDYAFSSSRLASIEIPDSVTTIGDYAFSNCTKITSVVIGDGVTTIGDMIFRGCQNLTSAAIGDSVTTIDSDTFYRCRKLTSVIIGKSVNQIGEGVFDDCTNLKDVFYRESSTKWNTINIEANNNNLEYANIIYNAVKITAYGKENEMLFVKGVAPSQTVYNSSLDKNGYTHKLYVDRTFSDTTDDDLYITEDTDIYIEYTPVIEFGGNEKIVLDEMLVKEIYFATEKKANYMICEIIYPDVLEFNSITPRDFKYATNESLKNKDGLNYLTVICQYADDETTVPENTSINPFDLSFTVPKTAKPQEIEIKFGEDTYLSGEEDYPFENKINAKIEILPKLASSVTIYGNSTIYEPTKFAAEVYPDYTTDKTIVWSVNDKTVATISKDGILTPVKNGSVTITATAVGGNYNKKTVKVYRNAYVDGFKSDVGMWNEKILPDTKQYTIYVTEDTDVISITPLFTTGTLSYNGAVMMKNRAKEFELTENETTITLTRANNGYETCTYTIKVIKESGLKNETIKTDSFKENCINILVYNGKVKQIEKTEDITITIPDATKNYKVLYWESLANLKPVYAPIEKEF